MRQPLVVAIPSKGRLMDAARAALANAGLDIVQVARSYRGTIAGTAGAEVAFLSAPEIAREIGAGAVHLGIRGRDQIEESVADWKRRADFTKPLGFGSCAVVVAVPEALHGAGRWRLRAGLGLELRRTPGRMALRQGHQRLFPGG